MNLIRFKKTILTLAVCFIPFCLFAQAEQYNEDEIKAAYIEKLTRFIDWPDKVNVENGNSHFVIGLIGEHSLTSIIKDMYSDLKIKGKKVEIKNISSLDEIARCNILFMSHLEDYRINQILSLTKNNPILTISDDADHSKKDVLITLFNKSNHIYFHINKDAFQQSGIYVSTLLLNLSKDIKTEDN